MGKKETKVKKKVIASDKRYRIYKIKSIRYNDHVMYGVNREEPDYKKRIGCTLIIPSTYIMSKGYPMFVLYYQDQSGNEILGKAIRTSPVQKVIYTDDEVNELTVETENSVYILELVGEIRKKAEKQKIDYMLSWMCDTFRWVSNWEIK